MSNENQAPTSTTPSKPTPAPNTTPRRSSISFGDIFARPSISNSSSSSPSNSPNLTTPSLSSSTSTSTTPPTKPGSMASAMAAQSQRRLSITTLGLSGGVPGVTSPFGGINRGDSMSAAIATPAGRIRRGSVSDDEAVEDGPPLSASTNGATPSSPFQRRMSFGARAYRDNVRATSGGSPTGSLGTSAAAAAPAAAIPAAAPAASTAAAAKSASPPSAGKSPGFNWSDTLRSRAERTSIASPTSAGNMPGSMGSALSALHSRQKSGAGQQAQPASPPPKPVVKKPDHFQERILKGDFYMD